MNLLELRQLAVALSHRIYLSMEIIFSYIRLQASS